MIQIAIGSFLECKRKGVLFRMSVKFSAITLNLSHLDTSEHLQVLNSDEGDEDSDVLIKPGSGAQHGV